MINFKDSRFRFISFIPLILFLVLVFVQCKAEAEKRFKLHPPASLLEKIAQSKMPVPFIQTIPFSQGEVLPDAIGSIAVNGELLEATTSIINFWPDGSVRLMLTDGVVPVELLRNGILSASFENPKPEVKQRNPVDRLEKVNNHLVLIGSDDTILATMSMDAAWSPITKEKIIYPNDPHLNDKIAQYGWAHELADLDERAQSFSLKPRIHEVLLKKDEGVFADYIVRGDGGSVAPGDSLEWQLLLRMYRSTPVVRWQMTWTALWDPENYSLTRAAWLLRPDKGIESAAIPPGNNSPMSLDIRNSDAYVMFAPDGKGVVEGIAQRSGNVLNTLKVDSPDDRLHRVAAKSGDWTIGVTASDLSRLGPSHLLVNEDVLEVAAWSEISGLGMDLRSSTMPDEFGISHGDLTADGRGVAFSMDGALVFSKNEADVHELTSSEVMRDYLWFPSSFDLHETGALGDRIHPDTVGAGDDTARRYRGMQQSVYFMILSRDYWRWYGALNYGDVRTNFKGTSDQLHRGLYFDRWGLHGRYGWRNGASDVHGRMLYYGLLLEDRNIILAALDYARHVADVDVKHSSLFARPDGDQGGMHRRNKDHWSGGVEPQYTTSWGLYMASWITGDYRISQVLEEVRSFMLNTTRQSHSAFRADAWIHRYAETHDQNDLDIARNLLDASAQDWGGRSEVPEELDGLSVIYFNNFRRVGNGLLTLINFHSHTGDSSYLEAILKSLRYHGINSFEDSYVVAYLLSNGVSDETIGATLLGEAHQQVSQGGDSGPDVSPKSTWTYESIRDGITNNRQSYNIGRVMRYQPLANETFHRSER